MNTNIKTNSFRRPAAGLSLIEVLVALAIGSLLLLGLVQVFAASRAASLTSEGMARVQENGRFAIDFLQRDIRMAGHFGCVNDQAHWVKGAGDLVNHLDATEDALNFGISIRGYEATGTEPDQSVTVGGAAAGWNPGLPGEISLLNPLPGSDIISLRYLVNQGIPVNNLTVNGTNTVVEFPAGRMGALTGDGVAAPTMFGVADCSQVDVFEGEIIGNTIEADGAEFSGRYTAQPSGQTLLYRAESIVYYVADGASGTPALHRARADEGGAYTMVEELVEGVESLQFLYGRDSTPVINTETPPSGAITLQDTAETLDEDANEWLRVGLVQVGLLAASPDAAAAGEPVGADQHPRVLGVAFAPPVAQDTRYRTSYEVTVALRNRLFGN